MHRDFYTSSDNHLLSFLTIVQEFTIIHDILKGRDQNFTQCFSRVKD
jgi:hypothetical protein